MKRYFLIFTLSLFLVASFAHLAGAETTKVCHCLCSCDYTSIQKAIEEARRGDTIEISGGTYHESLVIDKSITLKGPKMKRAIVESQNPKQPAIIVGPSDVKVTLESLSISRNSSSKPEDMSVREFSVGLMAIGEGRVEITDTVIELNR